MRANPSCEQKIASLEVEIDRLLALLKEHYIEEVQPVQNRKGP